MSNRILKGRNGDTRIGISWVEKTETLVSPRSHQDRRNVSSGRKKIAINFTRVNSSKSESEMGTHSKWHGTFLPFTTRRR